MKEHAYSAALKLAATAHAGQFTLDGRPYVLHPIHVAEQFTDENDKIVAVCHDVIEDSGFDVDVVVASVRPPNPTLFRGALLLLTHKPNEPYDDYIQRIVDAKYEAGVVARRVKYADITHNMDLSRIPDSHPSKGKFVRRVEEKYRPARRKILNTMIKNLEPVLW